MWSPNFYLVNSVIVLLQLDNSSSIKKWSSSVPKAHLSIYYLHTYLYLKIDKDTQFWEVYHPNKRIKKNFENKIVTKQFLCIDFYSRN